MAMPTRSGDGPKYRMWRKTRSKNNPDWVCKNPKESNVGVDPNRNYDADFGGEGSESDVCHEIYRGPHAFSENATRSMKEFIEREKENVEWKMALTIHCYAQMIGYPWDNKNDKHPNWEAFQKLGDEAVRALMAVHGTNYTCGQIAPLLGAGAGGSDDWALMSGIFKYSYVLEVRDRGEFGFLLPPEQIQPTGEETFEALLVFFQFTDKIQ